MLGRIFGFLGGFSMTFLKIMLRQSLDDWSENYFITKTMAIMDRWQISEKFLRIFRETCGVYSVWSHGQILEGVSNRQKKTYLLDTTTFFEEVDITGITNIRLLSNSSTYAKFVLILVSYIKRALTSLLCYFPKRLRII